MTLKSKAFVAVAALLVAAIGVGIGSRVLSDRAPSDEAAPAQPPLIAGVPGLLPNRAAVAAPGGDSRVPAAMAEPITESASAASAGLEPAAVAIEVVDVHGRRVHEGTVELSTTHLEGARLLSEISKDMDRYGWFFEKYDLAKSNPVVIQGIPPEFWDRTLEAQATVAPYAPSAPVTLTLEAGKTAPVRLEVVPGRRVQFDVRGAAEGRPIPGARVISLTETSRRGIRLDGIDTEEGTGWATTAANGFCTVTELGPGRHRAEVLAPGFRTGRIDVQESDTGPVSVRLETAHDTGVLEVLVSDPDGGPVPGIRVHLNTSTQLVPLVAATDASGVARFTAVASGLQVLSFTEDWVRRSIDARWATEKHAELMTWAELGVGETRRLDLGYPRAGGVIACEVVDLAGQPLPGISVRLYGPMMREGKTDALGRIRFEGLVAGGYRSTVRGEQDWIDTVPRELGNGAHLEVRRLIGNRSISGLVRSAGEGHPVVSGAHVSVTGDSLTGSPTRADGSFAIPEAVAGHYQVEVSADGFANARVEVDVSAEADAAVPEILMRRGGRVFLDVLAADRPSLEGVRLRLRDSAGTGIDLRSDATGDHYRRTGILAAGRYVLEVVRSEKDRAERLIDVRDGEDSVVILPVR